jgi:hypothetical protein
MSWPNQFEQYDRWGDIRLELEEREVIRYESKAERARRAAEFTPLISLELLEDYLFAVEWSPEDRVFVARCWEIPLLHWTSDYSADEAVLGLYQSLVAMLISWGADLEGNRQDRHAQQRAEKISRMRFESGRAAARLRDEILGGEDSDED